MNFTGSFFIRIMLSRLTILAMLLAVAYTPPLILGQELASNSSAPKSQKKQNEPIKSNQNPPPITPSPPKLDADRDQTEAPAGAYGEQQSTINVTNPAPVPEAWSWHDKVAWMGSLLILGLGAGTLWWLIKQTKATQMAAEATLLNAQALINAERPWLVMNIEPDRDFPNLFRVKAANRGRTPAAIVSAADGYLIVPVREKLPVPPEYIRVKKFDAAPLVVQGESQLMFEYSRDHLRMAIDDQERFDSLGDGTKFVCLFGNVVYRDLLASESAEPHETRWCCIFLLGSDGRDQFFFVDGEKGYTKHS